MREARMIGWAMLGIGLAVTVLAGGPAIGQPQEKTPMAHRAKGTFEVKVTPVAEAVKSLASARMALDKTFQGDFAGTSKGEMWTTDTSVKGSAGYVAIEKVEGTLKGRRGSFTLMHHGTMSRGGNFQLLVAVVPDSGTDQLAGLTGKMTITIADGKHFYEIEYGLSEAP